MELKDLKLSACELDYIKNVQQCAIALSEVEEKKLILDYHKGNIDARKKLIEGNLYIVVNTALKFAQLNMDFSELIQEGNIKLINAIDSYDYNRSTRLSAYIYLVVYRKMRNMFVAKNYGYSYQENNKIAYELYTEYYKYINEHNEEPSDMILADILGLDILKVKEIKNHKINVDSLQQITSNPKVYNEVSLACDYEDDLINNVFDWEFKNIFMKHCQKLTNNQKTIVEYYLGIDKDSSYNFREIGNILGVKHQAINESYNRAMKRINERLRLKNPRACREHSENRVLVKK